MRQMVNILLLHQLPIPMSKSITGSMVGIFTVKNEVILSPPS